MTHPEKSPSKPAVAPASPELTDKDLTQVSGGQDTNSEWYPDDDIMKNGRRRYGSKTLPATEGRSVEP